MSLIDVVRLAGEEARRLNRKVIVSYTIPWHSSDVLHFVAAQEDSHRFFWQRGLLQLGGGGRLWAASAPFRDWPSLVSEVLQGWQGMVCPYFWGGLAFVGDGCLVLPHWLVRVEAEGRGELMVWDWVAPDSSLPLVEQKLAGLLDRLSHNQELTLQLGGGNTRSVVDGSPAWRQAVGKALEAIDQGQLEKVVLSRSVEVVGSEEFSAFGLLEQLREWGGDCTLFLVESQGKTFVGATPEMLLEFSWKQDQLELRSDALAGSSGRGELLLKSEKDLGEHQFVVDSILDAYRWVGAEVGEIIPPQLLELQHIQHLYTPILGRWRTGAWQDVFQLLEVLHPTAAVGGKPRDRALEFIRLYEMGEREGYAAPIGWFSGEGRGQFAVAIRSGYVTGNRVKMFAGAGIVKDSQIDREWEETNLKLQGMLRALGLAG